MTDLPNKSWLVGGGTTERQFQQALGAMFDFVSELVTGAPPEVLTIASGVVTPTKTFLRVDTEANTAADNLTAILNSNIGAKVIFLKSVESTRVVTLTHMAGGTGQIYSNTGEDIVLNNKDKVVVLYYDSTNSRWQELWRNWGVYAPSEEDVDELINVIGVGDAAMKNVGTGSDQVPQNLHLGALSKKNTIDASGLVGNNIIINDHFEDGTLELDKLAKGTAKSLIRFNSSGQATTLPFPDDTTKFLRADGTFVEVTVGGGGTTFGTPQSMAGGTTHTATTDGFITAYATGVNVDAAISIGGNVVARRSTVGNPSYVSLSAPVRKGDTWSVSSSTGGTVTIRWTPWS